MAGGPGNCPHSERLGYVHAWHGLPHWNCRGSHLPPEQAISIVQFYDTDVLSRSPHKLHLRWNVIMGILRGRF